MLNRLHIRNFTVFEDADFEFGPGLNVIVGTNGTGKSYVLKLGYSVLHCEQRKLKYFILHKTNMEAQGTANSPGSWGVDYADLVPKLVYVFRPSPSQASELIRRGASSQEAVVEYELFDSKHIRVPPGSLAITVNGSRETPLQLSPPVTNKLTASLAAPALIPAKEVLTLGWMRPASEQLVLPVDESYLDLLAQLSGLSLRKPEPTAAAALQQLTTVLEGEVEEDSGRFYLTSPKEKRLEMNMVAEGLRKFGTLQKLLANGSLTPKATLFWDEPEANLNPMRLRQMAAILAEMARAGFQIILATHSLFLMKELHILSQKQPTKVRYFGLYAGKAGATQVETTDDFMQLQHVAALDAELNQTYDFEDALDQANVDDNGA